MENNIESILTELRNEVILVNLKWIQYKKLYKKSEGRISILNEAAGQFFGLLQLIHFEDIVLHIMRLMDPVESCGKKNFSMNLLPKILLDNDTKEKINSLLNKIKNDLDVMKEWRNKRMVHRDYKQSLAIQKNPLPNITTDIIESVLKTFREILNKLEKKYWNFETDYNDFSNSNKDADSLFHYLELGIKVNKIKKAFLRRNSEKAIALIKRLLDEFNA